jgi:hypothetical protein
MFKKILNSGLIALFIATCITATVYAVQIGGAGNSNGEYNGGMAPNAQLLQLLSTPFKSGSGTVSSTGVNVTGAGTDFFKEVKPGDTFNVNGVNRSVKNVTGADTLELETAFQPDLSNVAFKISSPVFSIGTNGNVGIGVSSATQKLSVSGMISAGNFMGAPVCNAGGEGAFYYNKTNHYYCFCNGTANVKMEDSTQNCF